MFKINYVKVSRLKEKIDNSIFVLSRYADKIDLKPLYNVKKDFEDKLKDFETREKKLRIGIIGQVKAGKSSFINSLLFEGDEILPTAATPKTANLTVIRYGKKYKIEVEFYSKDEFKAILKNASLKDESQEIKVAKEIKKLYENSGISIENIDRKIKEIEVDNIKELEGVLNDYAGENGKYTAITKNITLYINDERLKDIEIIDTPGLNDPVISRTIKTKELMKKADVVFFLSVCTQFIDKTDIELLTRQLPSEGVKKFVIIASKFDSALLDVGWDTDSFEEAIEEIEEDLINRAKMSLTQKTKDTVIKAINSALPPIFISSMAYNLAIKENLNEKEKYTLKELNDLWEDFELDKDKLNKIANFTQIKQILDDIIKKAEKILEERLNNIVPSSNEKLVSVLKSYDEEVTRRIKDLQETRLEHLISQKKIFENNKFEISSAIAEVINNVKSEIMKEKEDFKNANVKFVKQAQEIREREGTNLIEISTSKWWNPFSWGSKDYKSIPYKYYLAADAVENIVNFVNKNISFIEKNFNEVLDSKKIKLALKKRLIDVIDTSSEDYSPAYFKYIIESVIQVIEVPSISISYQSFVDKINAKFQGEIKEGSMGELKKELIDTLLILNNEIKNNVEAEIRNINFILDNVKDLLMGKLTEKIDADIKRLEKELENKELELEKYSELKKEIEKLIAVNYARIQ